jgi:hypothetical protein
VGWSNKYRIGLCSVIGNRIRWLALTTVGNSKKSVVAIVGP